MYVVVQFEVRNSKEKRIFTRFLSEENLCKTIRLSGGGGLYSSCPNISSESEILEIRWKRYILSAYLVFLHTIYSMTQSSIITQNIFRYIVNEVKPLLFWSIISSSACFIVHAHYFCYCWWLIYLFEIVAWFGKKGATTIKLVELLNRNKPEYFS